MYFFIITLSNRRLDMTLDGSWQGPAGETAWDRFKGIFELACNRAKVDPEITRTTFYHVEPM